MLKKTFTYTDYNGTERQEDHYFNISKTELAEMEMGTDGGFTEMLQRIVNSKDMKEIATVFKKIILLAYGEKSPDGRRFMKSEEISKAFSETEMYNQLFMELAFDAKAAIAFVKAILPPNSTEGAPSPNVTGLPAKE